MGVDVDTDVDVNIINGDFSSAVGWTVTGEWSIAGGKAIIDRTAPVQGLVGRYVADVVQGNVYRITFDLLVADFIDEPAKGVIVSMFGQIFGPFNTIGIKTIDFFNKFPSQSFAFTTNSIDIGDYAEIDFVTIEPLGPYLDNPLGFDWPKIRYANFQTGINSEFWQNFASQNGKTNCLIGYDIP